MKPWDSPRACGRRPLGGGWEPALAFMRMWQAARRSWEPAQIITWQAAETKQGFSWEPSKRMWQAAGRGWEPALNIMWQAAETKQGFSWEPSTRMWQAAGRGWEPALNIHHVAGSRSSENFGWEPDMCMWQAAESGWEPAQLSPREAGQQISRERLPKSASERRHRRRGSNQDGRTSSSDKPSKYGQARFSMDAKDAFVQMFLLVCRI